VSIWKYDSPEKGSASAGIGRIRMMDRNGIRNVTRIASWFFRSSTSVRVNCMHCSAQCRRLVAIATFPSQRSAPSPFLNFFTGTKPPRKLVSVSFVACSNVRNLVGVSPCDRLSLYDSATWMRFFSSMETFLSLWVLGIGTMAMVDVISVYDRRRGCKSVPASLVAHGSTNSTRRRPSRARRRSLTSMHAGQYRKSPSVSAS
jgi:hypothetical protein